MDMRRQARRLVTGLTASARILVVAALGSTLLYAQEAPEPVATTADAGPTLMPEPATLTPNVNVGGEATPVTLLVGRSTLIDIGASIARVSLTSSDVADALVTAPSQLLLHGKEPGSISMLVWSRGGAITRFEVAVERNLAALNEQVEALFPTEDIQVDTNGRQVVLSGRVSSEEVIGRASNLAAGFVGGPEAVVNLLQLREERSNQVLLRVRFAEVSRNALTELGASFFTSPTGVRNTVGRLTTNQFGAPTFSELEWSKSGEALREFGRPVESASGKIEFQDFLNLFLLSERYDLGLMLRALENQGLFQSLAEPNLVAESGKEASFLAGGEFPIPIAQGSGNGTAVTVDYKEFGIRLNFTPTVDGDIVHLKVRPEVSTLDYGNAVILQGFRIPALTTRRTETELSLRDGQTFAIAGLINNEMNSTMQKIPWLGDIPILGNFFKSKAAQKGQTELVVMITPEILPVGSMGVTGDLPQFVEPFIPGLPADRMLPPPPPAFTPDAGPTAENLPEPTTAAPRAQAPAPAEDRERSAQVARERAEQARIAAREAEEAREQAERQAKVEAEQQKKDEERQAQLAREEAKRQAELAKREAEQAKREEERQRELAAAEERLKEAFEELQALAQSDEQ